MSKPEVSLDEHLLRARAGNRSGLGHVLETLRPLLDAIAKKEIRYPLRKRMSESDLVQDTMLTASAAFSEFQGTSAAEFRAWLLRVFETRLADGMWRHLVAERRRQSRDRSGVSPLLADGSPMPSDAILQKSNPDAWSKLSPNCRLTIAGLCCYVMFSSSALTRLPHSLTFPWQQSGDAGDEPLNNSDGALPHDHTTSAFA